jgi:hypothetical protein
MSVRRLVLGGASPLLILMAACGGEPEPVPSGRSMTVVPIEKSVGNRPPTIESVALIPKKPVPGSVIDATVRAEDPDQDGVRLSLQWLRNGKEVPGATRARLSTDGMKKGDRLELRVVASDGRLESKPSIKRLRLNNRPPLLQGVAFQTKTVRGGDTIEAGPIASDPDGDSIRFKYRWFVNDRKADQDGDHFDTTGLERDDRVRAEVVASDGETDTQAVSSLEVVIGNGPPRLLGVPTPKLVDGTWVYAFRAEDPDGDKNLRFRLNRAPSGMQIDAKTGEVRWTPSFDQAGGHQVEIVVQDSFGDGNAIAFDVKVDVETAPAAAAP